jgi:TonB-dependent receptor
MKFIPKALPITSRALFTIVGGVVLINPVFAQEPASEELEEVVVTGLRGSLKASLETKRDAVGVVDSINAEDIGKFPDTNLAESLQRITGVSIDRRNGEGALVTARGFGPAFNMVTLNGRQMPGADAYGSGDSITSGQGAGSRSFNFANLSSEAISAVEVYKTSRADLPTGGIGATVNVKTARPFDNDGMVMNVGVKAARDESAPFDNDITPEVSGIFSFANDSKSFGVGLNASYSKRHSGSVQATVNNWNIRGWDATQSNPASPTRDTTISPTANIENAPAVGQLYGIPNDIRYAFSDLERERINGQAVVQFAPMESLTFTLDYTFAQQELAEDRGEQTIWMQRNGSFDHIVFDTGEDVATPVLLHELTGAQKDFGFEQQRNEQKNQLKSLGFNMDWKITDSFKLGVDFHDSKATSDPNDPITGGGQTAFSFAGTNCPTTNPPAAFNPTNGNPVAACSGFWTQQFEFNNGLPIMTRTLFPDQASAIANTGGNPDVQFGQQTLGSQVLRINYQQQETEVKQARIDGQFEFENGRFQFGVDTRKVEMHQRTSGGYLEMGTWSVNDASQATGMVDMVTPFNLSGLFGDFNSAGSPTGAFRGNATQLGLWAMQSGQIGTGRDPVTLVARPPRLYTNWSDASMTDGELRYDPLYDNDNLVEEDVKAVYFSVGMKGELGTMPTNLNIGVRYEETDVTSTAQIVVPAFNAMVWLSNNDFRLDRAGAATSFAEDASYNHLLPSLDFDIGLTDSVKGRFSYSKTIARAQYGQLFAGSNPGTPNGSSLVASTTHASGTSNNPALVPLESNNFDMSLEWYFSDTGYVSGGLFEKRVTNFTGNEVVESTLFGIKDPTAGPDVEAARLYLQTHGGQCGGTCPIDDTSLFTATVMLQNPSTGGLAAFDGSTPQANAMEAFDVLATSANPDYVFNVSKPINNKEAKIHGWEMGGQYFFGDSGFGVLANYTIVRGDVEFDNTLSPTENQFALLGLSDSANAVVMFEKFGLSARLAYNWRDEFLAQTNVGGGNRNPIYVEPYDQIDLSVGYNLNEHMSVSFEAINLTGEDVRWHARSIKQVYRLEDQSPRYALGARYKF